MYKIIKKNNKYGLINEKGNIILKCKYDYIWYLEYDDTRIVIKDGKYGIIKYDKIILPVIYNSLTLLESDYKQWKILDKFVN